MSPAGYTPVELGRDCDVTLIPSGRKMTLRAGEHVVVTQALGGTFTVQTEGGHLARLTSEDAGALGFDDGPAGEQPSPSGPFELDMVIEQLRTVFDPEIPINVVDLGLIYACDAHLLEDGSYRVEIKMSMTAPGCGMGDVLRDDADARVRTLPGVGDVDVELVWDPPWDQSRMSDAARLELGLY
ncbi:MAG: putative Fe-S cluster assembly protein SufT [Acidimicrobiales bacterium]